MVNASRLIAKQNHIGGRTGVTKYFVVKSQFDCSPHITF